MSHKPHRVAVIGAGVSGIVTAAHLQREGLEVTIFERCSAAGGVWLYDEREPLEPFYPSIIASTAEQYNIQGRNQKLSETQIQWLRHAPPGPCYAGLQNNVATRLLETTLHPFPTGTPDFVSHSILKDYIQEVALRTGVHELIRFNTEVKRLFKVNNEWTLEAETLELPSPNELSLSSYSSKFDTVVVASGHYHAPRVPDIPGLVDWKQRWSDRIQHSKRYRKPDEFKNKNVLLIGASVSSTDIARELSPVANYIYQSHRNGAFDLPASLLPENALRIEEVVSFDYPIDTDGFAALSPDDPIPATVTLKTGQKLCDIHSIILCTGYHITLPFLPDFHADSTPPSLVDPTTLVTDGTQLHNLHKDIFYIPDPSLLFIGVPYFTATFTLFEFQAMVAAKVLAGKAQLPSEQDMRTEYEGRVKNKGFGKGFHSLREEEVEYVDELLGWVNGELVNEKLDGHTLAWKKAKQEQIERIRAMFADRVGTEREVKTLC